MTQSDSKKIHLAKANKATIEQIGIPTFRFNFDYGKDFLAHGMKLDIFKAKVVINDNGCFIVGFFSNITNFVLGEWVKPQNSDPKAKSVLEPVSPDKYPRAGELICLQLEKKDNYSGYTAFHGLFHYVTRNGGEIKDSYFLLDPSKYSFLALDANGEPPADSTVNAILTLAKDQKCAEVVFRDPSVDTDTAWEEISKIKIDDNLGKKSGWGGGNSVTVNMETLSDRSKARLDLLLSDDFRNQVYNAYMKWMPETKEDPDLHPGVFSFIEFLGIILK